MPVLPWSAIDTVLLDMDGTLLDLHYDNQFWLEHLPQRYAELHGVSRAMAELELQPLFERNAGTLNWYCLDFWSRELNLPIRELKQEIADLIALRPDADTFLAAIRQAGKRVVLITNAHRDSLSLKLERVELAPYFERLISSTTTDFPRKARSSGTPCRRTSASILRAACSSTTPWRSCAVRDASAWSICWPCASPTARRDRVILRSSPRWRITGNCWKVCEHAVADEPAPTTITRERAHPRIGTTGNQSGMRSTCPG